MCDPYLLYLANKNMFKLKQITLVISLLLGARPIKCQFTPFREMQNSIKVRSF